MSMQKTTIDSASEYRSGSALIIEWRKYKESGQGRRNRGKKHHPRQSVRSGSGKEIKAKGRSKGVRESVKCDDQSGCVRWTGIARQALVPGQAPRCALSSGQDHRFATDDLEPVA